MQFSAVQMVRRMDEISKFIQKELDRAIITGKIQHGEDQLGIRLVKSGIITDFKSEVTAVDSETDPEKFVVHVKRTVFPKQQAEFIKLDFKILPSGHTGFM
jgi:hypothetical protein